MTRIMSSTMMALWAVGAFAAPAPPVPAIYPSTGNDGFVYANIDKSNKGPVFKFCPEGYHVNEIDDGPKGYGCGPYGKGSAWDGHYKFSQIVKSVTAQEYLDNEFGKGIVEYIGIAPTGNGSYNAVIFYRIKK